VKVDVDIADELLAQAMELARRFGWSVDRLFGEALSEYAARHSADRARGIFSGIDTSVSREDDRV
jgi:hypothetical protein